MTNPVMTIKPLSIDGFTSTDRHLFVASAILLGLGIVLIASASIEVAAKQYGNPFYHLIRHGIYLLCGGTAMLLAYMTRIDWLERVGWIFLVLAILGLALVLVPGVGREVNGSLRWISLGPVNLQPSEFAKLFLVVYLAGYLSRRLGEVRSRWSGFLKPMVVLAVMVLLLLLEPDFGAMVVMLIAAMGMMFLGGVRIGQFIILLAFSGVAIGVIAIAKPYRMQRLATFMDPWAEENVFSGGYQLTQALIAFGRGEWFGVGLGQSVQKLFYLPEAHTDFIFAILAEEFGLLGSMAVLSLFAMVTYRALLIGRKAEKMKRFFSAYLAYGLGLIFASQVLINVGVNTGLLPTKGLTLPFLSYGGSSLISCCLALGILLRIGFENTQCQRESEGAATQ